MSVFPAGYWISVEATIVKSTPSIDLNFVLSGSTYIDERLVHALKAPIDIVLTFFEIVIVVTEEHA